MKKIISFTILLAFVLLIAGEMVSVFKVNNTSEQFGKVLPKNTLIYDRDGKKFWVLTASAIATNTLTTATKQVADSAVVASAIHDSLNQAQVNFAGDIKIKGNDLTFGNGASVTNPSSGILSLNSTVVSVPADSTNIGGVLSVDKIRANTIIANSLQTDSSVCVIKNGDSLLIRTDYDATRDLVQVVNVFKDPATGDNAPIEFLKTYLIPYTNSSTLSGILSSGVIVHNMGDNAAPYNYDPKTMNYANSSYFDGNHGYDGMEIAIVTSHDKTTEDNGSIWTDGAGKDFALVRIVDATTLWFLSKDTDTMTGNLTHKANATHTAGITVNSLGTDPQYEPTVNNRVKKAYLSDGAEIVSDGVYYTKELRVKDTHYIANITASLDSIIAHVGESDNTVLNLGEPDALVDISMIFDKYGNCTQNHLFKAYRILDITYMAGMQSSKLTKGSYDSIFVSIPNSLPISDGVKTWSMDRLYDFSSNPAADLWLNSTYWSNTSEPVNRITQFLGTTSSNLDVGFYQQYNNTSGYGKDYSRLSNATNAWRLASTGKSYPYYADSKIGDISENQTFNVMLSTGYFNPKEYSENGQAYLFSDGNSYILNSDYNFITNKDTISLPENLEKYKTAVLNKSSAITFNNTITDNKIYTSSTSNGHLTIKLSNITDEITNELTYYNEIDILDTVRLAGNLIKTSPNISSARLGLDAGRVSTGSGNIFIGGRAGYTSGKSGFNTFAGYEAGYYTNAGGNNTFIGRRAGYANVSGTDNTFIGMQSGNGNTGKYNTASGVSALNGAGTSYYNTANGYKSGYSNTTGSNNLFSGYYSAAANTTGSYGVALGDSAGYNNTTGSRNVFIGHKAIGTDTSSDQFILQSDNGNKVQRLMQGSFADSSLTVNGYMYKKKQPFAKFKRTTTFTPSAADTWLRVPICEVSGAHNTPHFTIAADSSIVISKAMMLNVNSAVKKYIGVNTNETVLFRLVKGVLGGSRVYSICGQYEETVGQDIGDNRTIGIPSSDMGFAAGDSLWLEMKTTDVGIILQPNTNFANPASATMNIKYLFDL